MNFPRTKALIEKLDCGLTVILDPTPKAPVVSTQLWVETGSQHEHNHLGAGISHFLEHMVFKGSKKYNNLELAQTVQSAGGQWNAYTSFDRTVYYIDGPSGSLKTYLDTLLDMVFHPLLPADEFDSEKEVIHREIAMGNDDPSSVASQQLFETTYQHDPRKHPVIGNRNRFDALTIEDLRHYHQTRYRPSNTFLVISGDFTPETALQTLQELTAPLKDLPTCPIPHEPEAPLFGNRKNRKNFPTTISHLTIAWQVGTREEPDQPALQILSQILGGGDSSPLNQIFHEQRELCHDISSWYWSTQTPPGLFAISAETDYENRNQLEQELLKNLPTIISEITEKDLAKAKRQILSAQFRTLATTSGRATDLGSNWHKARNLNFTSDYLTKLNNLTLQQIKETAQNQLLTKNHLTTSLDPEEQTQPKKSKNNKTKNKENLLLHQLPNGLKLVLKREPSLPTVSLAASFLAGTATGTAEKSGLEILHASTLFKETENKNSAEFSNALESLGARLTANVGANTAQISGRCLSPDLPELLSLFAEGLTRPAFSPALIKREKKALIAALREQLQDPAALAFRELKTSLFGKTSYGLSMLGEEATLAALNENDLETHHQKAFTAHNGTLAIYGDHDPEHTLAWLLEALDMHPGKRRHITAQPTASPPHKTVPLNKEQAVLALGWHGVGINSAHLPALNLIHEHLNNMAGPLFTNIREKHGLAYYVSSMLSHGISSGIFACYLGTSPAQLPQANQLLRAEMDKLQKNGISAEELHRAQASWLSHDALSNQSNRAQATKSALDLLLLDDHTNSAQLRKQIQNLTPNNIKEAIEHTFQNEPAEIIVTPID